MRTEFKYRVSLSVALNMLILGASSVAALAQAAPAAGCLFAPAKMSDSDINAFLAKPNSLLSDFPAAGLAMSSKVRALTGSSTADLDPMMAIARDANGPQKSAIGAGLGRAAKSCQSTTPDYVLLIQQKVAAANDATLTAAFLAGMDDLQTAALGNASTGASAASGITSGGIPGGSQGGTSSADSGTKTVATTFNSRTNSTFTTGTTARFTTTIFERTSSSPAGS